VLQLISVAGALLILGAYAANQFRAAVGLSAARRRLGAGERLGTISAGASSTIPELTELSLAPYNPKRDFFQTVQAE
jgi:hypothetical protein